jgi:hypothetical protein
MSERCEDCGKLILTDEQWQRVDEWALDLEGSGHSSVGEGLVEKAYAHYCQCDNDLG